MAAKNQQQNTTTNQKYAGAKKEGKETRRFNEGGTAGEGRYHHFGENRVGSGGKKLK